jgi:hypothetical protein
LLTDYGLDLDREFLVDAADELAALRLDKALLEVAETKPSKFDRPSPWHASEERY